MQTRQTPASAAAIDRLRRAASTPWTSGARAVLLPLLAAMLLVSTGCGFAGGMIGRAIGQQLLQTDQGASVGRMVGRVVGEQIGKSLREDQLRQARNHRATCPACNRRSFWPRASLRHTEGRARCDCGHSFVIPGYAVSSSSSPRPSSGSTEGRDRPPAFVRTDDARTPATPPVNRVGIRVSSAIGIEPLMLGFSAECPAEWADTARFSWTLNGVPIGQEANGQQTIHAVGEHIIAVSILTEAGDTYSTQRTVRVLPRRLSQG